MSGVRLDGVVAAYGAAWVVHEIDLEVQQGQSAIPIGPSGCGKSTTLRMTAERKKFPMKLRPSTGGAKPGLRKRTAAWR